MKNILWLLMLTWFNSMAQLVPVAKVFLLIGINDLARNITTDSIIKNIFNHKISSPENTLNEIY